MPTVNRGGATRYVILTRKYAIKVPRFWGHNPHGRFSFAGFLTGLLANMQERTFAKTEWPELCPVYFSVPGGWLLIMPRCEPCTEELTDEQYERFRERGTYVVPVEHKAESFGYFRGRLVAIDYGS